MTWEQAEPDLRDAKGRTPEECWAVGDVFLFRGAALDGEPLEETRGTG